MPQVQSSLKGTVAPPVANRTSMSGALFWKSASRGISQRVAKVGPTPTVSTRDAADRGDVRGQVGELVEQLRQPGLIGAARGGGHEPVGLAFEQRHAEPLLEQMHHPADRGAA